MPLQIHRARHKRSGYLPPSGSIVESIPTPTATFLVQNTQVTDPNSTPTDVPLVSSPLLDGASTTAATSPTPGAGSSTSSSNQISLGTVIGACAAAVVAFLLAVGLAFYCSKRYNSSPVYSKSRNTANNASRQRSHLEPWKQMEDGDQPEGQERSMKQQTSGPLGTMFHRTISNTSAEKSSEHNRESVGTMHHFSKYHPGLAAEMASQCTGKGAGDEIAKPSPAFHLMGRGLDGTPPISWDGETVRGDSFMSHPGLSNSMAPHMLAKEKSTPPATTSSLHRWESAEVVHLDQFDSDLPEIREPPNPFADHASSAKSSPKGRNPFFSAQDHPTRRIPNTQKNPFVDSDSARESSAIQSLIAALDVPHLPDSDRIVSLQSSVYSHASVDDGDSAISVTAFPYPPTQVRLR